MKLWSAHTEQSDSIAGYLADREGLKGIGRSRFIGLLDSSFGFKLRRPNRSVFALGAWVASVAVAGILLELSRGLSVVSVLLWLGVTSLGAALVFALVRVQRQPSPSSREIEWRAYCLLIRPMILAERPGLLDCNLATGSNEGKQEIAAPAVTNLLRGIRPINVWLPASVGWGVGAAALIFWNFVFGAERGVFVLPLLGSFLGPLVWGLFRLSAYVRVERLVRARS